MIYGDLDHLKEINDTWGASGRNFALRSVAEILKGCLRSNDILGRVGGDEYIIMLECEEADFGKKFRERVKMACKLFNEKSGKPFLVEISLGIAEFRPKYFQQTSHPQGGRGGGGGAWMRWRKSARVAHWGMISLACFLNWVILL